MVGFFFQPPPPRVFNEIELQGIIHCLSVLVFKITHEQKQFYAQFPKFSKMNGNAPSPQEKENP